MTHPAVPRNLHLLESPVMFEAFLVSEKTVATAKGDGPTMELKSSEGRVYLLTLTITDIIEQESLDVMIYGSADGTTWGAKPVTVFPQKFYRASHPLLLDLSAQKEVKFLRAHWEVNRWGRGSETPRFEFSIAIKEVPAEILKEAAAEAKPLV